MIPNTMLCGCGSFFRVKQLSVTVEEQTDDGAPIALWSADLFRCDSCGAEVISGFALVPMARRHDPFYADIWRGSRPVYPGRRVKGA